MGAGADLSEAAVCCDPPPTLPEEVETALARYRAYCVRLGVDWADQHPEATAVVIASGAREAGRGLAAHGGSPDRLGAPLPDFVELGLAVSGAAPLPAGTLCLTLTGAAPDVDVRAGAPALRLSAPAVVQVVVVNDTTIPHDIDVAGWPLVVPAGKTRCAVAVTADSAPQILVDGQPVSTTPLVEQKRPCALTLEAPHVVRWSVLDARGDAWFPDNALRKYDAHGRPFFHARSARVDVPEGTVTVTATRGMDFTPSEHRFDATAPSQRVVLDPARRRDPRSTGWISADLHVHMNYSGDLVCTPTDAALMQAGECLDVMHCLAANETTSLIFDEAALHAWLGGPAPWSPPDSVAMMGVEYRNDLYGHVHAFGLDSPPSRFATGHERSDNPEDWPANDRACADLRERAAVVGYCHPVWHRHDDAVEPADIFDQADPRSVECRWLVVDAALGLVDSVDVASCADDRSAAILYRHLIGAGLRLAVTAGTDVFLSHSRARRASNPPGWSRTYAFVDGQLSAAALQEAIRRRRTFVTNGPWAELRVDGHRVGTTLDSKRGQRLEVTVDVEGPGADRVEVRDAAGVVAASDVNGPSRFRVAYDVTGPTYLVAVVTGDGGDQVLDDVATAHTSPVWVACEGRSVVHEPDVRWCLRWLDHLTLTVRTHARLPEEHQRRDIEDALAAARRFYLGQLPTAGRNPAGDSEHI